jgi:hypothetical protein
MMNSIKAATLWVVRQVAALVTAVAMMALAVVVGNLLTVAIGVAVWYVFLK